MLPLAHMPPRTACKSTKGVLLVPLYMLYIRSGAEQTPPVRVMDEVVQISLLRGELAVHWPSAAHVTAVPKNLAAGIHKHEIAVSHLLHVCHAE